MPVKKEVWNSIREGALAALPLAFGYLPVAMAFGLLAKNTALFFQDSFLCSLLVYAGASQFMALDMIRDGISIGSIILATFLLNLRHFIMSASLSVRLQAVKKRWLFLIAFGVTDETFSVLSLNDRELTLPYLLTLQVVPYLSWVGGTMVGYLAGALLPASIQLSLGIGLYALFMALLAPELKKSRSVLLLAAMSGIFYTVGAHFQLLPASWCFIAAVILASGIGAFVIKEDV